jgi:hypothetical protein
MNHLQQLYKFLAAFATTHVDVTPNGIILKRCYLFKRCIDFDSVACLIVTNFKKHTNVMGREVESLLSYGRANLQSKESVFFLLREPEVFVKAVSRPGLKIIQRTHERRFA